MSQDTCERCPATSQCVSEGRHATYAHGYVPDLHKRRRALTAFGTDRRGAGPAGSTAARVLSSVSEESMVDLSAGSCVRWKAIGSPAVDVRPADGRLKSTPQRTARDERIPVLRVRSYRSAAVRRRAG